MNIFYSPEILNGNHFLDEEESRHAVKVLRLKPNDLITIVDGKGGYYEARITNDNFKKCEFKIVQEVKEYGKKNFSIHIAIAPTKNADRYEWFAEKAVEIGIDKITFIKCNRSERKHVNAERVEKIAVSAMKQSLKAYIPQIGELISFSEFIKNTKEAEKYIAHLEDDRKDLMSSAQKGKNYCILIGPEGDFTPEEINLAKENGFLPVSLGNSRLRTETAGIVACHILNLING